MNRALHILLALGLVLSAHPAAWAEEANDSCTDRPYVGVCAQGCDVDKKEPSAAGISKRAEFPIIAAQVDCDRTPYLSPLCGDSVW